MIVEAKVPDMIIRGTPEEFRRASITHPESEALQLAWVLEAMADALEDFIKEKPECDS